MTIMSCEFESHFLHEINAAEIAQLVEHNLAKVRVASSSLVFRSKIEFQRNLRLDLLYDGHVKSVLKVSVTDKFNFND